VVSAGSQEVIEAMKASLSKGENPMLMVVDMQQGIVGDVSVFKEQIREQATVIKFATSFEPPIPVIDMKMGRSSSVHSEIYSAIRDSLLFDAEKLYCDAFSNVSAISSGKVFLDDDIIPIGDFIREKGVGALFLVGCVDTVCVRSTAEGALRQKENLNVYVDRSINIPPPKAGDTSWKDIEGNERLHFITSPSCPE